MSIAWRLRRLERTLRIGADHDTIQLILVMSVRLDGAKFATFPSHAYIAGHTNEQLAAELGETTEAFEARCNRHLFLREAGSNRGVRAE